MREQNIQALVKKIYDEKYLLQPIDHLLSELISLVSFPYVEDLFYTDQGYQYIANRLIDYDQRKKDNLTKDELINIVDKIMNVEGEEYEIDNLILILKQSVQDPNITDYIYYSDEELTAKQIVEKALDYGTKNS